MIRVMVNRQTGLKSGEARLLSIGLFLFGMMVFVIAAGSAVVIFSAMHSSVSWGPAVLFLAILLLFAVAGIGVMIFSARLPGATREQKARQGRHPDQPWLWREDWEQGFARAAGRSKAVFRMSSMPGVPGGKLRGVIETGGQPCAGKMDVVLNCILWKRQYRTGFSEILWENKAVAVCSSGNNGAQVAVEFDIPFDVRATGSLGSGGWDEVFWRLAASSEDGAFSASFTVPVFPTAESDANQTREKLDAAAGAQLGDYAPAEGRIGKAMTPEGIAYHFPRARNKSMASMTTFFALIMLGITFVLGFLLSQKPGLGMLAGVLIGGVIGLVLLVTAIWLWFANTTVTVAAREIRIHSNCLGIAHTQLVHGEDIRGFEINPGMQKGNEVWYDVQLQTVNGKSANAGTGMTKTEAEWFAAELRSDLR